MNEPNARGPDVWAGWSPAYRPDCYADARQALADLGRERDSLAARVETLETELASLQEVADPLGLPAASDFAASLGLAVSRVMGDLRDARSRVATLEAALRDAHTFLSIGGPLTPGERSEMISLLEGALRQIAKWTPHVRGCDEPDDPSCARCVADATLAASKEMQ